MGKGPSPNNSIDHSTKAFKLILVNDGLENIRWRNSDGDAINLGDAARRTTRSLSDKSSIERVLEGPRIRNTKGQELSKITRQKLRLIGNSWTI
jgi:hypothetical protein